MKHGCLTLLILIVFIASGCAQPQAETPTLPSNAGANPPAEEALPIHTLAPAEQAAEVPSTPTPTPTPSPSVPRKEPSILERVRLLQGYKIETIYPAPLASPAGIAILPSGNFIIAENNVFDIKEVTPAGKVSTIATGLAVTGVAINQQGEVFMGGNGIWKMSPQGEPSRFSDVRVSKMAFGPDGYLYTVNWHDSSPDIMKISPEGKATVFFTGLSRPSGIAFSPSGELYVADPGSQGIIKVGNDSNVTTIVKDLNTDPIAIRFDNQGILYFAGGWAGKAEQGLYKVSPADGSISTIAVEPIIKSAYGDMAFDDSGNVFLISITYGILYRISPQGEVTILVEGWHNSRGLVFGSAGELYIADFSRYPLAPGRILKLDSNGTVTTFVDGLGHPSSLALDTSGNLFVSDPYGEILRITPKGKKQVLLRLHNPQSIAYDPTSGDLFVFLVDTDEIFRITPKGNFTKVAIDFGDDVFDGRLAVDSQGNLLASVVYAKNLGVGPTFSSLFRITTDGNVKLLAKFTDEVPCLLTNIAICPSGDAFLLGHPLGPFEIRKVTPEGEVSVFASNLPIDPFGIAINGDGDIIFSSASGVYRIFR